MARHERHQTNILNWQYNSKQYVQPHTPPLANSWLSSFISHSSSHTKQQKKPTCFRLPTKLSCKITSFSHYFSATSAPQPISWDQNKGDAYAGFTCSNFSFYWNIFWGWRKHSFLSFFFSHWRRAFMSYSVLNYWSSDSVTTKFSRIQSPENYFVLTCY